MPSRMVQVIGAPPWSDLPPELLGLVLLRLPKRADRAFFSAVCRTWCAAARQCRLPPPSPVPWLVLPGGNFISLPNGETFQLPGGVRYHNSCGEWLLLSQDDDSCFLMNPLTESTIRLPSLHSYSPYEEPVEVAEDCMIPDDEMQGTWMEIKDLNEVSVVALAVCSTHLIAAIVVAGSFGTIALCRPGADAWSVSAHEPSRLLSCMVFFQGKIHAFDNYASPADLIAFDIVDDPYSDEPRVSRIERLIEGTSLLSQRHPLSMHYLLESYGTLLMVRRKLFCERRQGIIEIVASQFNVFRADFERHLWADLRTLENDQALFLGQHCSRAVQVSPYDLSRDCIFFLDHCTNWSREKTVSCGVYDMKDDKVHLPLPMVSWKFGKIPAAWLFSQDAGKSKTDKLQTAGEHL